MTEQVQQIQKVTATRRPFWPTDAVMVVAVSPEEVEPHERQLVVPAPCRRCGAVVCPDSRTILQAVRHAGQTGRPVQFFCIACAGRYDQSNLQKVGMNSDRY